MPAYKKAFPIWIANNEGYHLSAAKGDLSYAEVVAKFGRNPDIDTATDPEDVWDAGGLWVPPTAARVHNLASASTADTSAGRGARSVVVEGLSSSYTVQTETVTLAGTASVATTNSYTRIYRMYLATAGTATVNQGNITATAATDGTVTAQINASMGQTLMAVYTVPAGKKNLGPLKGRADGLLDSYGRVYSGPEPVELGSDLYEPYDLVQFLCFLGLVAQLSTRFPVLQDPSRWLGHCHVKGTKRDPGPHFPWDLVKHTVEQDWDAVTSNLFSRGLHHEY